MLPELFRKMVPELCFVCINAGDLKSKVDLLCANLQLLKNKFSVIAVSEVWTDATHQYTGIYEISQITVRRQKRRGVAFHFDSDLILTLKSRPDLESLDTGLYESIFVQVSQPDHPIEKHLIIGVIYKPPRTDTDKFLASFSLTLDRLNNENRPSYLLGDYNFDILKYANVKHSQSFLTFVGR